MNVDFVVDVLHLERTVGKYVRNIVGPLLPAYQRFILDLGTPGTLTPMPATPIVDLAGLTGFILDPRMSAPTVLPRFNLAEFSTVFLMWSELRQFLMDLSDSAVVGNPEDDRRVAVPIRTVALRLMDLSVTSWPDRFERDLPDVRVRLPPLPDEVTSAASLLEPASQAFNRLLPLVVIVVRISLAKEPRLLSESFVPMEEIRSLDLRIFLSPEAVFIDEHLTLRLRAVPAHALPGLAAGRPLFEPLLEANILPRGYDGPVRATAWHGANLYVSQLPPRARAARMRPDGSALSPTVWESVIDAIEGIDTINLDEVLAEGTSPCRPDARTGLLAVGVLVVFRSFTTSYGDVERRLVGRVQLEYRNAYLAPLPPRESLDARWFGSLVRDREAFRAQVLESWRQFALPSDPSFNPLGVRVMRTSVKILAPGETIAAIVKAAATEELAAFARRVASGVESLPAGRVIDINRVSTSWLERGGFDLTMVFRIVDFCPIVASDLDVTISARVFLNEVLSPLEFPSAPGLHVEATLHTELSRADLDVCEYSLFGIGLLAAPAISLGLGVLAPIILLFAEMGAEATVTNAVRDALAPPPSRGPLLPPGCVPPPRPPPAPPVFVQIGPDQLVGTVALGLPPRIGPFPLLSAPVPGIASTGLWLRATFEDWNVTETASPPNFLFSEESAFGVTSACEPDVALWTWWVTITNTHRFPIRVGRPFWRAGGRRLPRVLVDGELGFSIWEGRTRFARSMSDPRGVLLPAASSLTFYLDIPVFSTLPLPGLEVTSLERAAMAERFSAVWGERFYVGVPTSMGVGLGSVLLRQPTREDLEQAVLRCRMLGRVRPGPPWISGSTSSATMDSVTRALGDVLREMPRYVVGPDPETGLLLAEPTVRDASAAVLFPFARADASPFRLRDDGTRAPEAATAASVGELLLRRIEPWT
ncbi:MAG: hypothetical protein HY909_12345 [Deltaproteobacteria bacterium]|nr:hypothetical protein [Deltaproteobacteria bacterium]